jgi:hypothetical protein
LISLGPIDTSDDVPQRQLKAMAVSAGKPGRQLGVGA